MSDEIEGRLIAPRPARCGGSGFIAIPAVVAGPPDGECCAGCPDCEPPMPRDRQKRIAQIIAEFNDVERERGIGTAVQCLAEALDRVEGQLDDADRAEAGAGRPSASPTTTSTICAAHERHNCQLCFPTNAADVARPSAEPLLPPLTRYSPAVGIGGVPMGLLPDSEGHWYQAAEVDAARVHLQAKVDELRGTPAFRLDVLFDELRKRFPDPEPLSARAYEGRFLSMLDEMLGARVRLQEELDAERRASTALTTRMDRHEQERLGPLSPASGRPSAEPLLLLFTKIREDFVRQEAECVSVAAQIRKRIGTPVEFDGDQSTLAHYERMTTYYAERARSLAEVDAARVRLQEELGQYHQALASENITKLEAEADRVRLQQALKEMTRQREQQKQAALHWESERCHEYAKAEAAEDAIAALRTRLREHEWEGLRSLCPACEAHRSTGHLSDCWLSALLAASAGPQAPRTPPRAEPTP